MTTSLDREPTEFTAGDTVSWTRSLADYPASAGWVLSYRFISPTAKFDVTGSASGDDHAVTIAATTSVAYTAGTYAWQAYVTLAAVRHTVGSGTTVVAPNLAAVTAAGYDNRTPARKALDALNAGLEAFGSNAHVQGYQIEGREMRYRTFADFMAARDRLALEVRREEDATRESQGRVGRNRLRVVFR